MSESREKLNALLSEMEDFLSCPICGEALHTAMLLPCSHAYCSQCIRKCLNLKEQCPVCREKAMPSQLRNNRLLDELASRFTSLQSLVDAALHSDSDAPTAVLDQTETSPMDSPGKRKLPDTVPDSSSKRETRRKASTEPPSNTCPICNKPLPSSTLAINQHIDRCLTSPSTKLPSAASEMLSNEAYSETTDRKTRQWTLLRSMAPTHNRRPIPPTHYRTLKNKELKELLRKHGLSDQGDRSVLERRHREFRNLYNAESDAKKPRSHTTLIRELQTVERTREQQARTTSSAGRKKGEDDPFAELIAQAAKTMPGRTQRPGVGEEEGQSGSGLSTLSLSKGNITSDRTDVDSADVSSDHERVTSNSADTHSTASPPQLLKHSPVFSPAESNVPTTSTIKSPPKSPQPLFPRPDEEKNEETSAVTHPVVISID